MSRAKLLLVCGPFAAAGLGLALHGTVRVNARSAELVAVRAEADAAGAAFVATLRGEDAERQRLLFERRRALAVELAAARRDRLLGLLLAGAAGLAGSVLSVMARIASEVEEDRRHVEAERAAGRQGRSPRDPAESR
jgi:hypothetical protein